MSKYCIVIMGAGAHHLGHQTGNLEKDADYLAKGLLEQLKKGGHSIEAAVFLPEGGTEELLAGDIAHLYSVQTLLTANPEKPAGTDLERAIEMLKRIDENTTVIGGDEEDDPAGEILAELRGLREEFRQFVNYERADDAPKVRVPKALAHLEPHQQRVVVEKTALDELVSKLDTFIASSPIFQGLDEAERERLVRQLSCMREYSDILAERVAVFPAAPAPTPKKKKGGAGEEKPALAPLGADGQGTGGAPLNQAAGVQMLEKVTFGEGTGTGSTAPSGPPVDADGKPPVPGDTPASEDGAQKEAGAAEETGTTQA